MAGENQVVIEFVPDTEKFNQELEIQKKNLQSFGDTGKKAFEELNKWYAILHAGQKTTGIEAKTLSDKFRELGVSIPAEVLRKYAGELDDVVKKHITLRTQLLNAKQAFAELTEQGKKGTAEWNAARATLQKVAMQVDDLNKTVARLSSSTKVFAGLIDAAKGVAAGFEIARGASVLFGSENKKAEEAIKQLVAVMAVLQGLQEVQLLLKEESAAMQLILNGRDLAAVGIKKLQTAAESENIIVSKAATAAQWALNAAMEANPIMIIVGALAAATAALIYFTRETGESKEEVKKFNDEYAALNDTLYKSTLQRRKITGEITEQQKKELEVISESEKKKKSIIDETEKQIAEIRSSNAWTRDYAKIERLEKEQAKKLAVVEKDKQNQLYNIRQEGFEEGQIQESDKNKKAEQAALDASKKRIDIEIRNLEVRRKLEISASEEDIALFKKIQEKKIERAKLGGAGSSEIAVMKKEQEQALQEYVGKALKAQSDVSEATRTEAAKRAEDELKFITDFYEHRLEIDAAFVSMDFDEFKKWEEKKRDEYKKTADEAKKLEEEVAEARKKQLHEIGAAQDKADSERIKNIQLAIQKAIEISQRAADAIFQIEQQHRQADLDQALAKIDREKEEAIAAKNLTEAQKAAINKRFQRMEAAEKLKAWKADQKAAETQAAIKMALAVVNAWATSSTWVEAIIRSAAAVAIGGIEIGVIAAQKPPAFEKGTEYLQLGKNRPGTDTIPIMANEGERIVPTHINKMLKGIPNEELPNLVPPIPSAPDASTVNVIIPKTEIDYTKLAKAFAAELKNNPQTVVNIDKSGFSLHLIEKQRHIERLNNRYNG